MKFRGLCEGRGYPAVRIGVTDAAAPALEIQDQFTLTLEELLTAHRGTLAEAFGA